VTASINWHRRLAPPALALVGQSPQWTRVVRLAERYAPSRLPVLLIGATGTGKELLAQHIHRLSRRPGELVDVNCAALPRDVAESLLFGHRRGAFTGALEDTTGLIAQAANGTLFLDELSSMPVDGQAKLLRVLETGEFRPLGGAKQRVDFRVIGAVQDNVEMLLDAGLLRADLYHRIAAVILRLPSLRERTEDIALLAAHFAAARGLGIMETALDKLQTYDWPGNVRELRGVVEQAVVIAAGGPRIRVSHLEEALAGWRPSSRSGGRGRVGVAPQAGEHLALLRLCERLGGDREAIARTLAVSRATLYRRLKAAGIELRRITASQGFSRLDENS
jgi:transcriptional regulator with PAS, ATPase and Fis domain